MSKVLLTGTLRCAPQEIEAVTSLLDTHIRLSQNEPGCLSFELWQDELDPCTFHMSEVFISQAAFEKHQDRTQSSDWWRVTQHMRRDFKKSDA